MKYTIIILIAVATLLVSCTTQRSGCGTERDVQRHDKKRFISSVALKDSGTIAQANGYRRTTLVKVVRTMKGYRHLFVSDEGDTATLYMYPRLKTDSCYLLKNLCFS